MFLKISRASSRRPASAKASTYQKEQMRKAVSGTAEIVRLVVAHDKAVAHQALCRHFERLCDARIIRREKADFGQKQR